MQSEPAETLTVKLKGIRTLLVECAQFARPDSRFASLDNRRELIGKLGETIRFVVLFGMRVSMSHETAPRYGKRGKSK
jgi:hypothetical protein